MLPSHNRGDIGMKLTTLTAALFAFACTEAGANALHLNPAQSAQSSSMQTFGSTSVPVGYYDYCKRYQVRCSVGTEPGFVILDQNSWSEIIKTNNFVNLTIEPKTDEEIFGTPEKWEYPQNVGDCEDYALLKRKILNDKGFPLGSLLMTVGRDAKGGGHAVLTVVTDRGDYVLDNIEENVLNWRDAEIYFVKRQAQDNPNKWVSLVRG